MNARGCCAVAAGLLTLAAAGEACAVPTQWVNGGVSSITAQLPAYTVAIVGGKAVRFCSPTTGADFPVSPSNLHYDMLRSALLFGKAVEVGVHNFGLDPQSGTIKLCIDRVILKQ
jgi:hypothetical protein